MRLSWVELRDYRNHHHTRVDLRSDGLFVVAGPNGEGKTNLLEAMHFLYALGSPRVSASAPLVREGAEAAYVRGEFETRDGRSLVEVEIRRKGANRVQVDRSTVRRRRDLRRSVRVVLFGPFDLPVVTGDPSRRRAFIDEAVVLLQPSRDTLTTAYERVLRQRNRLLKEHDGRGAPDDLDAWDDQLVSTGSAVMRARAEATAAVASPASAAFQNVCGYGLVVAYAPNVTGPGEVEDAFRTQLAERRSDELVRRTSLVGPHRDELDLAVRDLGARSFASHGETWVAALAIRLGIASAVHDVIGEPPILVVDDPYSALDPSRRDRIARMLADREGQVVISVADEADIPPKADAIFDVHAGTVTRRGEAA
jgi:DNA replication and repair protein RecF